MAAGGYGLSAMAEQAGWVLAIDFGTTHTTAASWRGTHAEVIEVGGERRVPSVVYAADDGSLVVGRTAAELAAGEPGRALRASKGRLGEHAPAVLAGRAHDVTDIAAAVLGHVHAEAVRHVGLPPVEVRLTHPAAWSAPRREALLAAAHRARLPEPRLVPEPVAAAVAHAAEAAVPEGGHVLVYDLGGGTFDATALRAAGRGFDVVGRPSGDPAIGGDLFDELLAHHLGERLPPATWQRLQASEDGAWRQAALRLGEEARRAKEALSFHPSVDVVLGLPDGVVEQRVSQDDLLQLVQPYVDETVDVLRRTADMAGLGDRDLAAVHLAGGASRAPIVGERVEAAFPGVAVGRLGDPKAAVALGAARPEADRARWGERPAVSTPAPSTSPPPPPGPTPTPTPGDRTSRVAVLVTAAVLLVAATAAVVAWVATRDRSGDDPGQAQDQPGTSVPATSTSAAGTIATVEGRPATGDPATTTPANALTPVRQLLLAEDDVGQRFDPVPVDEGVFPCGLEQTTAPVDDGQVRFVDAAAAESVDHLVRRFADEATATDAFEEAVANAEACPSDTMEQGGFTFEVTQAVVPADLLATLVPACDEYAAAEIRLHEVDGLVPDEFIFVLGVRCGDLVTEVQLQSPDRDSLVADRELELVAETALQRVEAAATG